MIPSRHAEERWRQRFSSGEDMEEAMARSKKVGRASRVMRRILEVEGPRNRRNLMKRKGGVHVRFDAETMAVFICTGEGVVKTCYRLTF